MFKAVLSDLCLGSSRIRVWVRFLASLQNICELFSMQICPMRRLYREGACCHDLANDRDKTHTLQTSSRHELCHHGMNCSSSTIITCIDWCNCLRTGHTLFLYCFGERRNCICLTASRVLSLRECVLYAQVFTSKTSDNASKTSAAKQLLTQYGGAYLLTSTCFALVSFSLCYAAVNAGTD